MNKIDITGKRFGMLVAVEIAKDCENSGCGELKWLCKCDCGNFKIVRGSHLRGGHVKSCGCLKPPAEIPYGYKAKQMPLDYKRKYGCLICADKKECVNVLNENGKVLCKYADILDKYPSYAAYDKAMEATAEKYIVDLRKK